MPSQESSFPVQKASNTPLRRADELDDVSGRPPYNFETSRTLPGTMS